MLNLFIVATIKSLFFYNSIRLDTNQKKTCGDGSFFFELISELLFHAFSG